MQIVAAVIVIAFGIEMRYIENPITKSMNVFL